MSPTRLGSAMLQAQLVCVECGAVACGGARGWRAVLADDEEDPPPEIVAYCPECAEREFDRRAD